MRKFLFALALVVASVASLFAPSMHLPSAGATTCSTSWGSTAKSATGMSAAPITNVRAGQHTCFDRLVIDISGKAGGYRVSYVKQVVQDGSGKVVPLRGGAFIQIVSLDPAYDSSGRATYRPANKSELVNVSGYRTFRQVAFAGSFEGQTTFGLGVRARLPFRVFRVVDSTSSRLVIDVAHTW